VRGIEPGRDQPARLVTLAARVGEADIRPGAEGERAVLAAVDIVEAPELRPVGADEQV